jgi:hypothetical protein
MKHVQMEKLNVQQLQHVVQINKMVKLLIHVVHILKYDFSFLYLNKNVFKKRVFVVEQMVLFVVQIIIFVIHNNYHVN